MKYILSIFGFLILVGRANAAEVSCRPSIATVIDKVKNDVCRFQWKAGTCEQAVDEAVLLVDKNIEPTEIVAQIETGLMEHYSYALVDAIPAVKRNDEHEARVSIRAGVIALLVESGRLNNQK